MKKSGNGAEGGRAASAALVFDILKKAGVFATESQRAQRCVPHGPTLPELLCGPAAP